MLSGCDDAGIVPPALPVIASADAPQTPDASPDAEAPASTDDSPVPARYAEPVEEDVAAPDIFDDTGMGIWDGRPTLGGVWIAHPLAARPERVRIVNLQSGREVIGALFRREASLAGPAIQISSDAARSIGIVPGEPTQIRIVALRREVIPPEVLAARAAEAEETDAPAETEVAETEVAETEMAETEVAEPEVAEAEVAETEAPETEAPETEAPETRPDAPAAEPSAQDAPAPEADAPREEIETSAAEPPADPVPADAVPEDPAAPTEPAEAPAPAEPGALAAEDPGGTSPATATEDRAGTLEPGPAAPRETARPAPRAPAPIAPLSRPATPPGASAPEEAAPAAAQEAEPPAPGAEPVPKRPYVQVGMFGMPQNAEALRARLVRDGLPARSIERRVGERVFTRVLVGPARSEAELRRYLDEIRRRGFSDALPVPG